MLSEETRQAMTTWLRQATKPGQQLDQRWLSRYRELASYDGHWWLTPAGSLTGEEQAQWNRLSNQEAEDAMKEALSDVPIQSRERELASALAEQRQPRLFYPAIDIANVRRRIAGLLRLDYEIAQEEPSEIVRRLYHGTIEEEVDYLRLIEACYEGDSERFWHFNQRSDPQPTAEEMSTALAYMKRELLRGLKCRRARETGEHVVRLLRDQLHLSLDLSEAEAEQQNILPNGSSAFARQTVTAQTARRFFEAVLQEGGYDEWRVVIDPGASNTRIEQGLRSVFLPAKNLPLERVKHLLAHELAGHVGRCVAGTHSPIGLLGIHTQHSLPTDEGLAIWYERQAAARRGETFDSCRRSRSRLLHSHCESLPLIPTWTRISALLNGWTKSNFSEVDRIGRTFCKKSCCFTVKKKGVHKMYRHFSIVFDQPKPPEDDDRGEGGGSGNDEEE